MNFNSLVQTNFVEKSPLLVQLIQVIQREKFEVWTKMWIYIISWVSDKHSRAENVSLCSIFWSIFPHEVLVCHDIFHNCKLFLFFHLTHFFRTTLTQFVFLSCVCEIITCSFPCSLCSLLDVQCHRLVDATQCWLTSPTRAMASYLLYLIWLIGLEFILFQFCT